MKLRNSAAIPVLALILAGCGGSHPLLNKHGQGVPATAIPESAEHGKVTQQYEDGQQDFLVIMTKNITALTFPVGADTYRKCTVGKTYPDCKKGK